MSTPAETLHPNVECPDHTGVTRSAHTHTEHVASLPQVFGPWDFT